MMRPVYLVKFFTPLLFAFAAMSLLLLTGVGAMAQNSEKVIVGVVKGPDGETLPGVSVKLKNNDKVTAVTDQDGNYKIRTSDPNPTLVFSYIGFNTIELTSNGRLVLNVTLTQQSNGLNEVVVIGYGSVKKKDLTGSVAVVNMEELQKAPVKSFDDALGGRIAGVQVTALDGQPGSTTSIKIRGANSITGSTAPLFVVDGFAMDASFDLNTIAPSDIESIDVLKDASSTAIYGARGSNGVIMVTTKRGRVGDPVVNYNAYYGMQRDAKRLELLSPYEFVKLQLEISPSLYGAEYTSKVGRTLDDYIDMPEIDWYNLVFRTGIQQNHILSVTGGNEKTQYSISGSIFNQDGIIINSGYKRYQGKITIDQTVNSRMKIGATVNIGATNTFGTQVNADGGLLSFMPKLWKARPVQVDPNIDITTQLTDPDNVGIAPTTNPFLEAQNVLNQSFGRPLTANAYVQYKITKDLTLRLGGMVTTANSTTDNFNNSQTYKGANFSGSVLGVNGGETNSRSTNLSTENSLTYNKSIKDHNFILTGVYTLQTFNRSSFGGTATYVPNESLGISGLDEGTPNTIVSTSGNWGLQSFAGRATYRFRSKYNLTATIRADGSSKFLPKYRWAYFPSAAFAYRISDEKFMKKLSFITDAKFRVSYGTSGNNNVNGEYPAYSSMNFVLNGYSFGNAVPSQGAVANTLGNPDLKWETTTQTNVGLDLELFNGRVSFTGDYYNKVTKDLILIASLPASTGYPNAAKNVGSLSNTGLEFTLNTVNVTAKNFRWSTNFNISFNKNKILSLSENQEALTSSINNVTYYIAKIGRPVAMFYGLIFDGVYQYSDFNKSTAGVYTLKDGVPSNSTAALRGSIKPGDIKFVDINHDGIINSNDYTVIGDPNPDFIGGFTNNFQYRGFDLSTFFQFVYGNQVDDNNILKFEDGSVADINQFAEFANRWTPTNTNTNIPRAGGSTTNFNHSRGIKDGSFIALKTVQLGYTFPKSMLNKIGVKTLRIYTSAQNLFSINNYPGSSPDVSTRDTPLTPGFDNSAYPPSRIYVAGVNVSF